MIEKKLIEQKTKIFNTLYTKLKYHVDSYYVFLDPDDLLCCIENSNYWYSLWSHQKNSLNWKGFVQIDLAPINEKSILEIIETQQNRLRGEQ